MAGADKHAWPERAVPVQAVLDGAAHFFCSVLRFPLLSQNRGEDLDRIGSVALGLHFHLGLDIAARILVR